MIINTENTAKKKSPIIVTFPLLDHLDEVLQCGKNLSMLPCKDLSLLELSETYAYCLIRHGRSHSYTNMVRDEIEARDPKVPKHNYYQQGVGYSNQDYDYDYDDWDYKYDGRD